ncbi:MAG TPA: RNA polymerase sigma factor SigJ [Solirubrobacteraceae bacterium]|nr:RNA polymerase sigma factor SigJ [Solirubrobacteraceae bacterium]
MSDRAALAARFERERAHLQRVAYALLGSLSEAEDVVQEAWLRLERVRDAAAIGDLRAWLTRTVARLALDVLGSARRRREQYVGPWLPEPLIGRAEPVAAGSGGALAQDPADRVTLDESISMALLIVLERLTPAERVAFVLHDIFGLTFEQVAEVSGRSAPAARKLAQRARRHVETGRPRKPASAPQQRELALAFATACNEGDLERLMALLDPEVVWRTDGGGVVGAARKVHRGAQRVARAMIALAARGNASAARLAEVNGALGLLTRGEDGVLSVISLTIDADRIIAIDIIRNPDKLRLPSSLL